MSSSKKKIPPPEKPESNGETFGKSRVEAFSDGVFAIAITLLVLELRVPDNLSAPALMTALHHLGPKIGAYILSFTILGVYWFAHHVMLHALRHTDRTFLWLNNLYLLFVATIPFFAALLGSYPFQQVTVALYGANLVCTSGTLLLLWRYAGDGYRLLDRSVSPELVRAGNRRTGLAMGFYVLAIALSYVNTTVSRAIYWLVPLGYIFVQAVWDRRAAPQGSHAKSSPTE